jgi:hypothetical protein
MNIDRRIYHVNIGTIPCPEWDVRKAVRYRIRKLKLKKLHICEAIGYNQSSFQQYLAGTRELPVEYLLKIIPLLSLDYNENIPPEKKKSEIIKIVNV